MPKIRKPLTEDQRVIADELRQHYGGTLTISQITEFLGVSRMTGRKAANQIPWINVNGCRRWLASDVARYLTTEAAS